ncbi:MAG: hypothetical protein ABIU95_07140 [Burkholderiales bacterium]
MCHYHPTLGRAALLSERVTATSVLGTGIGIGIAGVDLTANVGPARALTVIFLSLAVGISGAR